MRPDPIAVGRVPNAYTRTAAAFSARAGASKAPQFLRADGTPMQRPGVQGWAALYNKPFLHEGKLVMFEGHSVPALYNGSRRRLLLDHDPKLEVGSTDDDLEFANCSTGLAFRMSLGNRHAAKIQTLVDSGGRACVSVGIEYKDCETQKIAGYDVEVVKRARLHEVSLVKAGAVPGTFAQIVDLAREEQNLNIACTSARFAADAAYASASQHLRRIEELVRGL